jgi:hypothetical protein
MVVQLSIPVGNVDSLLGLGYLSIEIHRSVDQGNSYQEVTADTATAATLASAKALTTFRVGGRLLKLQVDGGPEASIDFSSLIDFWSAAQVAARINEVVAGLASANDDVVTLASSTTGRASSLRINYCDSEDLGWVAGQVALGKGPRVALVSGQYLYAFSDVAGGPTDRYKWRFSASGQNPVSTFSEPILGSTAPLLDSSKLSIATATFIGLDGRPRPTTLILAAQTTSAQSIDGLFLGEGSSRTVQTDENGFLQCPLVRGMRVMMAVEGTRFIREFIVPNTDSFDLLTVMSAAPDEFTVQTVPALLTRRSL